MKEGIAVIAGWKKLSLMAMATLLMMHNAVLAQEDAQKDVQKDREGVAALSPEAAVPATPAPVLSQPRYETVRVALVTSAGPILLELEKERAPITTANFLRYVNAKFYNGGTFYRALNIAENFGLAQGGIRPLKAGDKLFPAIAHEPTSKTGLKHETGTISMARAEQGTARTDFFITVGDMSSLDAQPGQPPEQSGDNAGFAAFGRVVEGMDVVLKIMQGPVSPTLGEKEGMKGQMLAEPVRIITARQVVPEKAQ